MKAKANGIEINYEIEGNGPWLTMSHSLACNLHMWDPQMTALEGRFRMLRYDTRGHGASDVPGGAYTLEQLVADAAGLLDALSIEKVHFVGLSMGGMIAQGLALSHPERLDRLALCDTSAFMPPQAQPIVQERIETARKAGLSALVDSTLERWFTPDYLRQKDAGVDMIRNIFLASPLAGYIGCAEAEALHKTAQEVDTDDSEDESCSGATWVLITSRPDYFKAPLLAKASKPLAGTVRIRPWTDDYSNLLARLLSR